MTSPIKLSIVFLNFNKRAETQLTSETLQGLCEHRDDIEIIAVDNGSSDGTAEYLHAQPDLISLLLPDNTGIAGYSAGFQCAKGEYLLVLDDDSSPSTLTHIDDVLEKFAQNTHIGIIAAHIMTPEGSSQWSWHLPKNTTFSPSPFFIGCGFIIRRSLFKKMGWYPNNFFLYQNEIEVSFQARILGYDIYYDPDFIITHRGKPSIRPGWRRIFFPTRNTLWLIRGYYPRIQASYMIFSRIIIGFIRAIHFGEVKSYLTAVYEGLTHPIKKNILQSTLRQQFSPFFKQNSLIHQLFKRT